MAKGTRDQRRVASQQYRTTPYPIPCSHNNKQDSFPKKCRKSLDNQDWKDATCSVCMECPHNAVLLLCSSHDKGCRPYMCGTSLRYSNCLDQYKKAYTKAIPSHSSVPYPEELACPLCRGQVKGWTVVEPAREFLNSKKRSCMNEKCTFSGNYKELRKHVKAEHPCARPLEIDPALELKWRTLELECERDDVISIMRSAMAGARVSGDYVVEGDEAHSPRTGVAGNFMNMFLLWHAFGQSGTVDSRQLRRLSSSDYDASLVNWLGQSDRVLSGRSGRRRRPRE